MVAQDLELEEQGSGLAAAVPAKEEQERELEAVAAQDLAPEEQGSEAAESGQVMDLEPAPEEEPEREFLRGK